MVANEELISGSCTKPSHLHDIIFAKADIPELHQACSQQLSACGFQSLWNSLLCLYSQQDTRTGNSPQLGSSRTRCYGLSTWVKWTVLRIWSPEAVVFPWVQLQVPQLQTYAWLPEHYLCIHEKGSFTSIYNKALFYCPCNTYSEILPPIQ